MILIETQHHLYNFSNSYLARRFKNYLDVRSVPYKYYELQDDGSNIGLRGVEGARMTREQLMEGLVL